MKVWWFVAVVGFLGVALMASDKREQGPAVAGALHEYPAVGRAEEPPPTPMYAPVQVEAPPAAYAPLYFAGYPCTVDCSGHAAGYEWAEENGIDAPDDCDGNSASFIEGCQAYAEEQQGEVEED